MKEMMADEQVDWIQENKYNVILMVDWKFTVFCREVGFVEFYAFLVLFFLAKNVSLLFLLLFPSLGRQTILEYTLDI